MAIFDKSDKLDSADFSTHITTIAEGTSVVGKIDSDCDLHIAGEFEGEIHAKNTVKVIQSGVLKCTLKAQKLIVCGRFFGTADCDQIELTSGGEAEGKLISADLTIDSNSFFEGESIRRKQGDNTKLLDFTSDLPSKATLTTDKAKKPVS